jgi:hypothetical protein
VPYQLEDLINPLLGNAMIFHVDPSNRAESIVDLLSHSLLTLCTPVQEAFEGDNSNVSRSWCHAEYQRVTKLGEAGDT